MLVIGCDIDVICATGSNSFSRLVVGRRDKRSTVGKEGPESSQFEMRIFRCIDKE
jgi:hypothetical protein